MHWSTSSGLTDYPTAVETMEAHVNAMISGHAGERVWLVEHPPLYTIGTSGREDDLLMPGRFPVYQSGRGGQLTYHGPGQRVVYVMLDLRERGQDVRAFVDALEGWLVDALAAFDVNAYSVKERVGLWVKTRGSEAKVAALGIRLRRWVSFHGIALNVDPDLGHFSGIVPCGLKQYGVTSMKVLGAETDMAVIDGQLQESFRKVIGWEPRPLKSQPRRMTKDALASDDESSTSST